jgi:flagellar hook protein FlgE
MAASIGNGEGTIVDGEARGITFNEDGSFSSVTGTGTGDADIEILWTGLTSTQTMSLGFGTPGEFGGLTELGDERSAAAVDQDGYGAGSLSSLNVRSDGVLEGRFTNGQLRDLGQLGLALFANPGGLLRVGDSLFAASGNSGDPQSALAASGRAGRTVGGALEASNVDVTDQMVRLIESQRAFQASSRTVVTADNLVQEVLNLVR